ncbi:stage V sporulation protein AD [Clostridium sp. C2-6-12]|uniref:stage V sporulation protein AD n=1 Tax=Clostridium sp. C2-6-12 TaxID=2698832 RepID=UPI00136B48DB|nr:stage V sporulation protein AD [Clostridium sp. C2-6-12]
MLKGHQSWIFNSKPTILASAAVGGPFESNGALANDFDILYEDLWLGQDSYEKAEKALLEHACERAILKSKIQKEDINFFFSGDLMNQLISSSFAARTLGIPYLGIFGACSSSMEGLSLAAQLIDSKAAKYVVAAACSHNAAAEKTFRYPTDYGVQRPPTAQWTVTGAGAVVLGQNGNGPKVTSCTIGKVVDMGVSDPYNVGAAMAPAAVDTIEAHFRDLNIDASYYDLIATGDLGKVGHELANALLEKHGINMPKDIFTDCGLLIYTKEQPSFAGGSGCGCSATVTYGHLLNRMRKGELKKILVVATGALLSPISFQQKESIPSIAHAVSIEM